MVRPKVRRCEGAKTENELERVRCNCGNSEAAAVTVWEHSIRALCMQRVLGWRVHVTFGNFIAGSSQTS
jgi:hypothetical protein